MYIVQLRFIIVEFYERPNYIYNKNSIQTRIDRMSLNSAM